MNIFVLDTDPDFCAQYHCDKHAVKMIVEYAQLLSTAHRILDGKPEVIEYITSSGKKRTKKVYSLSDSREKILYKATHANHPCAIWARSSVNNYLWLVSLLDSLCKEYSHRYGRIHKVESSGLLKALLKAPQFFDQKIPHFLINSVMQMNPGLTGFAQAMPDEYKDEDPVKAYQNFYLGSKIKFAKWTNRTVPPFVSEAFPDVSLFERTR